MVVGTAVALAIRVVIAHGVVPDKPATSAPKRVRAGAATTARARVAGPETMAGTTEAVVPSVYRRIRSAVLLVVIVTVLGALTALLLVIGGAILLTGIRNAVQ